MLAIDLSNLGITSLYFHQNSELFVKPMDEFFTFELMYIDCFI